MRRGSPAGWRGGFVRFGEPRRYDVGRDKSIAGNSETVGGGTNGGIERPCSRVARQCRVGVGFEFVVTALMLLKRKEKMTN